MPRIFKWVLLMLSVSTLPVSANSLNTLQPQQRVVFVGDSITYAGHFVSQFETLLTLKNKRQFNFYNLALPSETVSGLSEVGHANGRFARPDVKTRFKRILQQLKPDLLVICYGINDGIYQPFNEQRFAAYKAGIEWLAETANTHQVEFVFLTAPTYDERQDPAYANVQDIYAAWLISKTYTEQWSVIDIYHPTKQVLWQKRQQDSNFYLAPDGVHPTQYGHWLIAKTLLNAWNMPEFMSVENYAQALAIYPMGDKIADLVSKKQNLIKAAWLSEIGHSRPGIKAGLAIDKLTPAVNKLSGRIERALNP